MPAGLSQIEAVRVIARAVGTALPRLGPARTGGGTIAFPASCPGITTMMETGSVEHDDEADGDPPSSVDGLHRYLSPRGLARFRAEQAALRHGERPRIVDIVSWAAGNGDRSENGDYLYGKRRLREIDRRLRFLDRRIRQAIVVEPGGAPDGAVRFGANHAGGILGGISTGQPIVARFAVKPTSSILTAVPAVDRLGHDVEVTTRGRHDPCVGIRAVPVGEAMLACVLADHLLRHRAQNPHGSTTLQLPGGLGAR